MFSNQLYFLLSAIILVVLFAAASPAQPPSDVMDSGLGGNNVITGTVLVSNGGRMERRIAIRLQTMTRGDRVTMTDENGTFAFRGLVSGDYTIVIDKEK